MGNGKWKMRQACQAMNASMTSRVCNEISPASSFATRSSCTDLLSSASIHSLTAQMPRGRPRVSAASSASNSQKRARSPTKSTPTRQSKRLKSSPVATTKTTPKKSQFFDHKPDDSESESAIENEASGYEDEDASASLMSSPPESDVENDDTSGEEFTSADEAPRKRKPARKANNGTRATAAQSRKGQELWRPGVKTGLAPGEAVFIPLPKAKEAGKTPYEDHTIHPNTMEFLGDLKKNNDRDWLKGKSIHAMSRKGVLMGELSPVHDPDYRQSQKDFNSFVEQLTERIIEVDDTIPELPPKDLVWYNLDSYFRIFGITPLYS